MKNRNPITNGNDLDISSRHNFCEMFRYASDAFPDKAALIHRNMSMTYAELDLLSDRVSWCIMSLGIKSGSILSISMERSMNAIAAMIGAWKAHCAYVFIDPGYPEHRIEYMQSECMSPLTITDEFFEKLECTPQDSEAAYYDDDLAVVIFTSGSTGNPKGVMISHRNVAELAKSHKFLNMSTNDVCGLFASLSFVAVLNDIFTILALGGTVDIIPSDIRKNIRALSEHYKSHNITFTFLPPHMASKFIQIDEDNTSLKTLVVGSEPTRNLKKRHYDIINVYSSSETCNYSTTFHIDYEARTYPIGKVKDTLKCYILDEDNNIVPEGTPGEICIAGPQVSLGYLNNPDKTSQQFIRNSFSDEPGFERIYKSGDIVRVLPDGNMEYIGRKDWMMKIRGFRVEATEVENAMLKFPGVLETSVKAFQDDGGTNVLCGYFIAEQSVQSHDFLDFLKTQLPAYMVPSILVQMEDFPRNFNNKVNKCELPEPDLASSRTTKALHFSL
jgi:amino acid adenylation domain-containing protein